MLDTAETQFVIFKACYSYMYPVKGEYESFGISNYRLMSYFSVNSQINGLIYCAVYSEVDER